MCVKIQDPINISLASGHMQNIQFAGVRTSRNFQRKHLCGEGKDGIFYDVLTSSSLFVHESKFKIDKTPRQERCPFLFALRGDIMF